MNKPNFASIVRAHSTPQALVFRCRLIPRITALDHPSNLQVARNPTATAIQSPLAKSRSGARPEWPARSAAAGAAAALLSQGVDVAPNPTRKPARYHRAATRWNLDDLVTALAQRRIWTRVVRVLVYAG